MPMATVVLRHYYFALSALSNLSYTFPGAVPQAFIFSRRWRSDPVTSTIRAVEVFTIEETRQLPQGQLVRETRRGLPVGQPQHPVKRPAVKITRHSPNVRYRLGTDSIQHRARNTLPETPRPMILFCESFARNKVVNN